MFVIAWKSKVTGATGRGTARFDYEEAERQCAELNRRYPALSHWPAAA